MTTTAETSETKRTAPPAGLIIAGILAIAGIAAWVYQLSAGMQVTGLGQSVAWGLYIAGFFTAAGAGGALLALVGLSEFIPLIDDKLRPKALALALASFISSGLLITMDVGNPVQLWRVITAFRISSKMTWDFWLLIIAGLVTLAYLMAVRPARTQKGLGALAILAALAVVSVEGWMLSSLSARPMWGSGSTLLSFLLGAAIAGLSLAALIRFEPAHLRPALAVALSLNLVFVLAEVLTGLISGEPRSAAETRLLLSGFPASVFWFHLIAGLLAPLLLIRAGSLPLAGGLALLGVLAEKLWLLAAGQAESWLALPAGSYFPNWVEFTAAAGVIAIGWLVYTGIVQARKDG